MEPISIYLYNHWHVIRLMSLGLFSWLFFSGFCHSKSPCFTTIWENIFGTFSFYLSPIGFFSQANQSDRVTSYAQPGHSGLSVVSCGFTFYNYDIYRGYSCIYRGNNTSYPFIGIIKGSWWLITLYIVRSDFVLVGDCLRIRSHEIHHHENIIWGHKFHFSNHLKQVKDRKGQKSLSCKV